MIIIFISVVILETILLEIILTGIICVHNSSSMEQLISYNIHPFKFYFKTTLTATLTDYVDYVDEIKKKNNNKIKNSKSDFSI